MTDYIVIAALVALAAFLLYRRLRGAVKGENSSCCGGGSSCACGTSTPPDAPEAHDSAAGEHACGGGCDGGCACREPRDS
ncbi:MAG: hypothetical protein NT031_15715 [Planctomycetota bacterium]|nr:hypothetical protein [Planctomycetota bacterium]